MNQANKQVTKVALVTGSARRIGATIVKTLHNAGYNVAIHCHNSLSEAHTLAVELNNKRCNSALIIQQDLALPHATESIIKTLRDWANRLDVLVNNASLFIQDLDAIDNWEQLFTVNVKIPFLLSQAARPLLAQHQGTIINITDTHAQKPLKGYGVYCQSKAALEMQTKALACELAPSIRVNAIAPGAIAWPEGCNSLDKTIQDKIIAKTLVKQHGKPEYIAQAVLALAENPFITGQVLKVDGGR